jgi:hypothetical protein
MAAAKRPAVHRLVARSRHRQALARDDEGLIVHPAVRREASAACGVPHHELAGTQHDRVALEVQADGALAHVQQAEEVGLARADLGRAPEAVAAIVDGMDERQLPSCHRDVLAEKASPEAGTARTANPKVYVRASTSRQPSVRFAVSTSRSSQDTSPKAG